MFAARPSPIGICGATVTLSSVATSAPRAYKGEIDLVGFDGPVLAFVEVKTRTSKPDAVSLPEDAITADKRRFVARMTRQFLMERRLSGINWRYDVLAIEARAGNRPVVRLHKGAFADQ